MKTAYSAEEKFVLLDKLLTGEATYTSLMRHDGMPVPKNTVRYWLEVAAKRRGLDKDPAWPTLRAAKLEYTLPDDGTSGVALVNLQKRLKDSLNEWSLTSFKAESLVKGNEPEPERHIARVDLDLVEQNKLLQEQIKMLEESIRQKNKMEAAMAQELDELHNRLGREEPCKTCETYMKQVNSLRAKISLREQQVLTMLDRILIREED